MCVAVPDDPPSIRYPPRLMLVFVVVVLGAHIHRLTLLFFLHFLLLLSRKGS